MGERRAAAAEWLASGEVVMTAAYSGRVPVAIAEGRNFGMAWKNQIFSMEYWGIVNGGDIEAGKQFIEFASSKDQQTAFAQTAAYGITNIEAQKSLDPARDRDLPTAEENLKDALNLGADFWLSHSQELQAKFTKWIAQ